MNFPDFDARFALTDLAAILARLQPLVDHQPKHPAQTELTQCLGALFAHAEAIELSVTRGAVAMDEARNGYEGLVELLLHAGDKPLPAHYLLSLLTPLLHYVQQAQSETRQQMCRLVGECKNVGV